MRGSDLVTCRTALSTVRGGTGRSYVRTWVTTVCEGRRIEAGEGLPELPEEPIRHVEQ